MATLRLDALFPGANILVERIDGNTVYLRQDLRDTAGWWFYWAFRLRGGQGRRLNVCFTNGSPVGVRGPAVSCDDGRSWRWLNADCSAESFVFEQPPECEACRLAFGMVYTQADWERFARTWPAGGGWRTEVLATTPAGRQAELLYAGCMEKGKPVHRVVVTARHHSCEMMASYALEGMVAAVLEDDPVGAWLRKHVQFLFVPFVDKDGVEAGDQGKNRPPRDHGQDYAGTSLYRETAALRKRVPRFAGDRGLTAAFDLHDPWIRGPRSEMVSQVAHSSHAVWREQQRFAAHLQDVCGRRALGLPYAADNDLPVGQAWNSGARGEVGMSFGEWAGKLPGTRLASVLEIPYASAGGVEVNATSARRFGRDLAEALVGYLRERP